MKACTFFGHRDTPKEVEPRLKAALLDLIEKDGVRLFYVGNQGSFDVMVRKQLSELKETHGIRYAIVLAYLPKKDFPLNTIYPEGLETVPRRYAICKRNLWMLERSTHVITYARGTSGNASAFKQLAERKGKTVIAL